MKRLTAGERAAYARNTPSWQFSTRRPGVLPLHTRGLETLLQVPTLIHDQHNAEFNNRCIPSGVASTPRSPSRHHQIYQVTRNPVNFLGLVSLIA